jgi:hypothetical protein
VNIKFTQTIAVRCDDPEIIVDMAREWDLMQAEQDVMGYLGSHVLADRDDPGRYLLVAEFGQVDPDVPAIEEAQRNNERPETQEFARRLRTVVDGEPIYNNYDELYRTG